MNLSIALTGKRQTSKPYSPCWKWFKYAMQQKQRMCRTRMSFLKNSLAQDKQKGLMNN